MCVIDKHIHIYYSKASISAVLISAIFEIVWFFAGPLINCANLGNSAVLDKFSVGVVFLEPLVHD